MLDFAIGDLVLMSGGVPAPGFTLQQPVEGLESPERRITKNNKPGQHGIDISGTLYGGRPITLTGSISAPAGGTFADYLSNRQAFIAATRLNLDDNNYRIPTTIRYTMLDGSQYAIDVVFDTPFMPLTAPTRCAFQVSATAGDAMIFSQTVVTSGAITPPVGGGFVVPMIVPFTTDAATGGSVVINNPGTGEAYPAVIDSSSGGIRLTGPLTTPVITNVTTGTALQLNYTIQSGDTVVVDMKAQTITLNGASLIAAKTLTSEWWSLLPGNNTVSLTTSSSGDTGSATVQFRVPFIGT